MSKACPWFVMYYQGIEDGDDHRPEGVKKSESLGNMHVG
jgi:hypothetical protein